MRTLNIRVGDTWTDGTRRARIVGGTDTIIQVRIRKQLHEFAFRYFVRRFQPLRVPRYNTSRQWRYVRAWNPSIDTDGWWFT